jgi:hypothetical protein
MSRRFVTVVVIAVGLFNLAIGIWAFVAPRSFFDALATFPPYNEHFLHDAGAFQMGLGVALLAALRIRDGLVVAMIGGAVAGVVHTLSHIIDSDLGGKATDPIGLGFLAAALVFALIVHSRDRSEATP